MGVALGDEERRFLLANMEVKSLRYGFKMVFVKLDFERNAEREREEGERTEWSKKVCGAKKHFRMITIQD